MTLDQINLKKVSLKATSSEWTMMEKISLDSEILQPDKKKSTQIQFISLSWAKKIFTQFS